MSNWEAIHKIVQSYGPKTCLKLHWKLFLDVKSKNIPQNWPKNLPEILMPYWIGPQDPVPRGWGRLLRMRAGRGRPGGCRRHQHPRAPMFRTPGWQFNSNFFGLCFSLKNRSSFGLRFPTKVWNLSRFVSAFVSTMGLQSLKVNNNTTETW